MNKKHILWLLASLPLMASAQSISSEKNTIDIGQVLYWQPTNATYTLKNASSKPITITGIELGSDFTSATYPKNTIAAGSSFNISVEFKGRVLGHFQRYITIHESGSDTPTVLYLKGNVVREIENFTGDYPFTMGTLLTDGNVIEFDDVNKGDQLVREIHVMNPSGQYVEPSVVRLPAYLSYAVEPTSLAPKSAGVIRFTLDSEKLRSFGLTQTNVYLLASQGEKISEEKTIEMSAVLLPPLVAEDDIRHKTGPHISLSTNSIDMTDFEGKAKKKAEVIITNNGVSELEITSMQMFTTGLEVTLPKRKIAAGQSVKMKITGKEALLKRVKTRPRILMITNDVDNQKVVIDIKK